MFIKQSYAQISGDSEPAFTIEADERKITIEWSENINSDVKVIDDNKNVLSSFDHSIKEILAIVDSSIRESFKSNPKPWE